MAKKKNRSAKQQISQKGKTQNQPKQVKGSVEETDEKAAETTEVQTASTKRGDSVDKPAKTQDKKSDKEHSDKEDESQPPSVDSSSKESRRQSQSEEAAVSAQAQPKGVRGSETDEEVAGYPDDYDQLDESPKAIQKRAKKNNRTTEEQAEFDRQFGMLMTEFKRYRFVVIALGVICVAIIGMALALYGGGVITGETQETMLTVAYVFVAAMLLIAIFRVRPLRKNIRECSDEKIRHEADPEHEAQIPAEASEALFPSLKNPPYPEYKRARKGWWAAILVGVAIMFLSMAMIRFNNGDMVPTLIVLFSAYIPIGIAVYIDRTRLKPLRDQWAREREKAKRREYRSKRKKRS